MSESQKWTQRIFQLPQKLGKFKYPVLILLLGMLLLLLPEKKSTEVTQIDAGSQTEAPTGLSLQEERLEALLSEIEGAGTVKVMLSLKSGEETLYQTDTQLQTSNSDTDESLRQEDNTVLYAAGSGNQEALVRQVLAPVYQGAIIVCQGADDPTVKLALVQAVASITGLGTDQITVVKMR